MKRRLGFLTKASVYLFVMGGLFCGALYPLALREYDKQTTAYAASLPDYSRVPAPIPWASGHAVKIEVPSVGVTLPVIDGSYDKESNTWTLSHDKVQFDTASKQPNSRSGNTFIYGHATTQVFGPLLQLQPDALAYVTTDNGYVFTYKLTSHEVVDPTNVGVLNYSGPSRLMLQTCTGPTLSEFRQMFYFSYAGHKKLT
jgi:LPXTG-site transpeptidase (sortase) family protein